MRWLNRLFLRWPVSADWFLVLVRILWPVWIRGRALVSRRSHRIDSISAAVTNICNAACVFCAYPNTKQKKGVMGRQTFEAAVGMVVEAGLTHIDLTPTVGDPLIDRSLEEKIIYAHHWGLTVSLTTNAILASGAAAGLIDAGLTEVFISCPSFTRDDYEEIYGVCQVDRARHGIRDFIEKSKERGYPCKVHIRIRNRLKPSEIMAQEFFQEYLKAEFNEHVTFSFTAAYDNWGGSIESLPDGMKMKPEHPNLNAACAGFSHLSVLFDGRIRACGCRFKETENDDLVVGNVRAGLEDAKYNAGLLRKKFMAGERPSCCVNCSFYNPV